jgi:hypothetical protein
MPLKCSVSKIDPSKTQVRSWWRADFQETTRYYTPEDITLHSHAQSSCGISANVNIILETVLCHGFQKLHLCPLSGRMKLIGLFASPVIDIAIWSTHADSDFDLSSEELASPLPNHSVLCSERKFYYVKLGYHFYSSARTCTVELN